MNKILPIVNIGAKSGQFKYILAQFGKNYLVRADPTLNYHGFPFIFFFNSKRRRFFSFFAEKIFEKLQTEVNGSLNELYILGGGKIKVDFEQKKINLFDQSEVNFSLFIFHLIRFCFVSPGLWTG